MGLLSKSVRFYYKSQIHCWFIFSHLGSSSYHRLSSLNRCACICQNECWWNFPLSYWVSNPSLCQLQFPSWRLQVLYKSQLCPAPCDRVRISTLPPLLQDYLPLPWQFCTSHTALILARILRNSTCFFLLIPWCHLFCFSGCKWGCLCSAIKGPQSFLPWQHSCLSFLLIIAVKRNHWERLRYSRILAKYM